MTSTTIEPSPLPEMALLAEQTRGNLVESRHLGALAVVDSCGRLLAAAGNPDAVAYLRSSAKPFQALPTVEAGALDYFNLDERALALMCASHYGTEEHVAVCRQILDTIGLGVDALLCGVHRPKDEATADRLTAAGVQPDARYNNCSGKHAGMLTLARFWELQDLDYPRPDHPVQQAIRARLAAMADLPAEEIVVGVDGCTVPVFALPLRHAALAFARLTDPAAPVACQRIVAAMQHYPHLVSGHGALDDTLMRAGRGALVSKGGAEGYQAVGVRTRDGDSVGIALKIADGAPRAIGPIIAGLLAELDLMDAATLEALAALRRPTILNHRRQVVGELRFLPNLSLFPTAAP